MHRRVGSDDSVGAVLVEPRLGNALQVEVALGAVGHVVLTTVVP